MKLNKALFLCLALIICSLNVIKGQSKYYTHLNNFEEFNCGGTRIKNNVLVDFNNSLENRFNVITTSDNGSNLSCLVRIANRNNTEGRVVTVYDKDGNKIKQKKTEWGFVWNYLDDDNYYVLKLSCNNTALHDVFDQRSMTCEVVEVENGVSKCVESIELLKGVNLYDKLNTIKVDFAENYVKLSIGDKKLQLITNISLCCGNVFNVGYFVGSGAEIEVERFVVKKIADNLTMLETGWTKTSIEDYFSGGNRDYVEGIWSYLDRNIDEDYLKLGGKYKLAIIKNDKGGYDLLYYDGAMVNADKWRCGMLKGRLTKTNFKDIYDLVWWGSVMDGFDDDTYATLTDFSILTLFFPVEKGQIRFVKM